jgi:hypothetical protein
MKSLSIVNYQLSIYDGIPSQRLGTRGKEREIKDLPFMSDPFVNL